mgnify:CR=1 FL=1
MHWEKDELRKALADIESRLIATGGMTLTGTIKSGKPEQRAAMAGVDTLREFIKAA